MFNEGKTWKRGTTWDHGDHNGRHETARMSCNEYRALIQVFEGRCGICRVEAGPALVIDHDHYHPWGVRATRGMLCDLCNPRIGYADNGGRPYTNAELAYISNPFHKLLPEKRPHRNEPFPWDVKELIFARRQVLAPVPLSDHSSS